jgi:hypothetical protein
MDREEQEGVVIIRGDATGFAQEIVAARINSSATNRHQWAEQTAARRRTTCSLLDLARVRP